MKRLLFALLLFLGSALSLFAADATLSTTTCPGSGCQTTTLSGVGSVAVQVSGTFVGILAFEASVDGTNYSSVLMSAIGSGGGASSSQLPGMWSGNVLGAVYFRVRFAQYTSGTASVSTVAASNPTTLAASTAVIGHTIVDAAPTTAVTGAFFQATQPISIASAPTTPVTGTFFQATQPVSVAATLTTQMSGWSFTNIITNATTVVKSGAGVLHCVTVNGLGTTETATIFDNTAGSGTKVGTVSVSAVGQTGCYDVSFATGLTIVTAGSLAADITVSWR